MPRIPACSTRAATWLAALLLTVSCHSVSAQLPPATVLPAEGAYPTAGLMPKLEIGAADFLAAHPEFDGRGVVIAVFDTGVDPGAAGLQTTSDGRPKIIDMVDATGSGDVHLSEAKKAGEDGRVQGLSGRMLQLPPEWLAKTREYRVGLKAGYDLFPPDLVRRLSSERKRQFTREQSAAEARLRREIDAWAAAHPEPNEAQKAERAELDKRLAQLVAMAESYEDPGPLFDCVAFLDGPTWRAAVDTNGDGDLGDEKALANFRLERQYATFRGGADLNFGVNIYNDGALLSIVADTGPHGTHVAGILAAHFADQPELSGIAPGAQIVAVKIGDPRLQEMETEPGLTRGIAAAVEARCDLINMSYGEPSRTPNEGMIAEMLNRAVSEHGVIFVSSAGNAGPALSTVGAPGGTISGSIGVGAYVTPAMMESAYALRDLLPEMPFTWTSRGPTFDGAAGVTLCAPGAAIAPVPNWTQQRTMRMNGTSMASPNACGGIALVLSALKQQGISYTPHSIRRALQNTARPLAEAEVFAQGAGVLQVPAAYEYLRQTGERPEDLEAIEITVGQQQRGVYLREPFEVNHVHDVAVRVQPKFRETSPGTQRIGFERRLRLHATAPWVRTGSSLLLTHGAEQFQLLVDPTALAPGAHYAEVQGFVADQPERGPLFRVPVTVVIPTVPAASEVVQQFALRPGSVERQFIAVPQDAVWADLVIERLDDGPAVRYMFQAVEKHAGRTFRDQQSEGGPTVAGRGRVARSFRVTGGKTLELCLAQFWSSLGETSVKCSLTFHALRVSETALVLTEGDGPTRVTLQNDARPRSLAARGRLETWRRSIAPASAELTVSADPRDRLPDGRTMHHLTLTYRLETFSGSGVTPRFGRTDGWLYDSPFAGHLWMLFDSAGRQVATDDIWPSSVTLRAGQHTLKLRVRHPDAQRLEPLRKLILQLDSPLAAPLTLRVSTDAWDLSRSPAGTLAPHEQMAVYIDTPERLPEGLRGGDQLLGNLQFAEALPMAGSTGDVPQGHPVRWLAVRSESAAKGSSGDGAGEEVPARQAALEQLKNLDTEEQREQHLTEIVAAADAVLATIDTAALARTLGQRAVPGDDASQQAQRQAEALRDVLADTLYRKGRALGYMELPEVVATHPIADPAAHDKAFSETYTQLARWVDTTQRKYVLLAVRHERRREHWGAALELLNKYLRDGAPDQRFYEKRQQVVEQLGWQHWVAHDRAWLLRQFPESQAKF